MTVETQTSSPQPLERPRVLVLYGGPDAERAVSIESGRGVAAALVELGRFDVLPLEIETVTAMELLAHDPDVVFPVLHGRWGEGGPLQEILEASGVPYVGSGPKASALAMDKLVTKTMAAATGVPTPRSQAIALGDAVDIRPPLVIKPIDEGSSVDLRICRTSDEVERGLAEILPRRRRLMLERYVTGREITAGVVLGEVLPLIEISAASGVYDYEAKYHRDDTRYVLDPALPKGVSDAIRLHALAMYRLLGCRDLARVDFMVDEQGPWLLEVNTLPGFTSHSLVPMAARHAGISMPELCGRLVDAARRRGTVPSSSRRSAVH